ncbi:hypothetical protein IG631_17576 [Alternaria alternata]|nr:hypothetical protein IG631_17576 [Alternaria alternata]
MVGTRLQLVPVPHQSGRSAGMTSSVSRRPAWGQPTCTTPSCSRKLVRPNLSSPNHATQSTRQPRQRPKVKTTRLHYITNAL